MAWRRGFLLFGNTDYCRIMIVLRQFILSDNRYVVQFVREECSGLDHCLEDNTLVMYCTIHIDLKYGGIWNVSLAS